MNSREIFMWKGFRRRRKEESPVFYCNNVAVIGDKVIFNNRHGQIASRNIGGELKFDSKSSSHFWDRRIERGITCPRHLVTTYKIDPINCTFDKDAL